MAERHRYRVYIDFISGREGDKLEQYLVKAVEKTGAQINYVSMKRSASIGRPSTTRPVIEEMLKKVEGDWEGIAEEIADSLNLKLPAVKRALKQLTEDGVLQRSYDVGSGVIYRLAPQ